MEMNSIPVLRSLSDFRATPERSYFAMYSSWAGGIVVDPALMMVPVDDHLVHRGDGVFETVKVYDGSPYLLDAHLARLRRSAEAIGMTVPCSMEALVGIVGRLCVEVDAPTYLIRLLVSRGPGGFSVNPYEPAGPELYVVAYPASAPFMDRFPEGARVGVSEVAVKPSRLAMVKTCNYLPNALMKKEAVDRGLHFVVGIDSDGFVAESFTENLCMVDGDGVLVRPGPTNILAGTTMNRCFELAEDLGISRAERGFTVEDVKGAKEVLIFGTTTEVTAVVEFDGVSIQGGRFGPVFEALSKRLREDF